jgi:gliding motility-associated-like protein
MINSTDQPTYAELKIDWATKQVISKRVFCSPPIGTDLNGNPLTEGVDNEYTRIFFQSNGNIIFVRRIWGIDFNGGDMLTKIFKVSTFDNNFNPIKSEYICTPLQFNWWIDWDYEMYIDSNAVRHIAIYDLPNQQIYYAISDQNGVFFLQKRVPHYANKKNKIQKSGIIEPGYFTSFDIVTSDNQYSYIDNFRILTKDTSSSCFGTNFNFLISKPANVSPINWNGNFTIQQAVIESAQTNFIAEDYPFEKSIICNIVHKCDTLKIHAPDTVCNISQPVIISAFKNQYCDGKINFQFDTTALASYTQVNDTTLQLQFNKSYKGWLYATASSCPVLKDSVELVVSAPSQTINLGSDTILCPNNTVSLHAGTNFENYQWQDGSTDSVYLVNQAGKYYVTTQDFCGNSYSDTIHIIKASYPLSLGNDVSICKTQSITLTATAGFSNYTWNPDYNISATNRQTVSVFPETTTAYTVTAEKFPGCDFNDTILVTVNNCPESFFVPKAFSPNHDGKNDLFKPIVSGILENYEFIVYNRWGQIVFKTKNKSEGWDGNVQGLPQDSGVFVWMCKYKFSNQQPETKSGTVMLIR